MNILLVYPLFPETFWGFERALAFNKKRAAFPPLGLLTVAALLPKYWNKRLVDLNVQSLESSDLEWADLVFVSAMIAQKQSMMTVIERCKAHGKRIVLGGPYVTTSGQDFGADHVFLGESETTIAEFVSDINGGMPKPVYSATERPSLDCSPVPEFHLARLDFYGAMSVQFSRGCPFQCEFCDIIEIYGRKPRTKSVEQLLMELTALYDLGWCGLVFIVDDNFIGNKRNVKALLPELATWSKARQYPFSFITEASVNLADDTELLEGMQQAGFRRVFLGIETPVEACLHEAQKGQNLRHDLLSSVRKIQHYGMEVMAGFIVGFDNDPEDVFERQIDFIRTSAIPLAMVGLLNALPGTQLWHRLDREKRLVAESSGNNTDGSLNFVPKMKSTALLAGYQTILRTIYEPSEYYQRALKCLSLVRPTFDETTGLGLLEKVSTLTRLVWTLGIVDPFRGSFWKYIYGVCRHHRRQFADALRLAAMGYHFRQLSQPAK